MKNIKEKKLVIVVDMINGFVKEGVLHDKKIMNIIPNIIDELEEVNKENRLFIVDEHSENAFEFKDFPIHCLKGTRECEIIDELKGYTEATSNFKESLIVRKNSTNACWALDLDKLIAQDIYDEVSITGCCTDICVMQLAIGMKTFMNEKNIDIPIVIREDCVSTYDAPNHNANEYQKMALKMMQMAGIKII